MGPSNSDRHNSGQYLSMDNFPVNTRNSEDTLTSRTLPRNSYETNTSKRSLSPVSVSETGAENEYAQQRRSETDAPTTPSKKERLSQPRKRSSYRSLIHTWRWELSTWLLGTAGFVATLALIITFNCTEQRIWHSNIQITAFIAALAQVSQSALLVPIGSSIGQLKWKWLEERRRLIDFDKFDLASRGPDGSLRLLWHLRLRPHLVSLGALSTLLMLAYPTFVQQSVSMTPRYITVPDAGQSYLHRATNLAESSLDYLGFGDSETGSFPDSTAIIQGILNDYINPMNTTGVCSTNHCTWDPYTTLSICSITEDVTSSLMPANVSSNGTIVSPPWISGPGQTSPVFSNTTFYTYMERPMELTGYLNGDYPQNNSDIIIPDIANLYMLFYDPCVETDEGVDVFTDILNIRNWKALKASFSPCLQTFSSTFDKFWTTDMRSSTQDIDWRVSLYGEMLLSYCTSAGSADDFCLSHTIMYDFAGSLHTTYNVSAEKQYGSENYLSPSHPSKWAQFIIRDIRGNDSRDRCNRQPLKSFDRRIQNIAASVSIELRNANHGTRLNGTAWRLEPMVEVSFPWLVMPIALYTGITLFFFATIIQTRNAATWKSSILPVLRVSDEKNTLATPKQFKQHAITAEVQLKDNGETWHLLESQQADDKETKKEEGQKETSRCDEV